MELTLFLAQLFGLYFIIMGSALLIKRKTLVFVINDLFKYSGFVFFTGIIILIMGLLLVLSHNVWEPGLAWIITLLAWVTLVKGMLYIFLPQAVLAKIGKRFSKNGWYPLAGIIAIAMGIYFISQGFDLF
ncbi:hypothetical protein IIB50_00610 [Patescibacteria group bacterium]|nr:hypothetical protein [Patescibacteria group bacterium]